VAGLRRSYGRVDREESSFYPSRGTASYFGRVSAFREAPASPTSENNQKIRAFGLTVSLHNEKMPSFPRTGCVVRAEDGPPDGADVTEYKKASHQAP
ncbi:MAG: hypothetical protein Q3Y13_04945, partial [Sutterella sp.]|nr:hypothetical protein [Sutterella sp.]